MQGAGSAEGVAVTVEVSPMDNSPRSATNIQQKQQLFYFEDTQRPLSRDSSDVTSHEQSGGSESNARGGGGSDGDNWRVSESHISRNEKIVHVVYDEKRASDNAASVHTGSKDPVHTRANTAHSHERPEALKLDTHDQQSQDSQPNNREPAAKTKRLTFTQHDDVTPPPVPRVGLNKEGEGLSLDVFIRCVDWLEDVHSVNSNRPVARPPPIQWKD